MQFTISPTSPFSLDYTLESGQVFRWENRGEWWYGVVGGGVLKARQEGERIMFESSSDRFDGAFAMNYFRLDEDLKQILVSMMKDKVITQAVQRFHGLRLIRQDGWECLASFILATNANIPRIKGMVSKVCESFGEEFEFEGARYHMFPTAERLSEASGAKLDQCGLGYRARFLKNVAESVSGGRVDFRELSLLGYAEAREMLLSRLFGAKLLLGVGPKVADCTLLFSCGKDEAFPIDVWIARSLLRFYPKLLDLRLRRKLGSRTEVRLTKQEYDRISTAARRHFGRYAGYAQQYLFMMAREEGSGS